ncbi:MAG: ribosome maturation factor RimM [Micropruina sp.]|uniref:ribosome maturation factor RimM n=1 Tax=Micropruina sp. TaxID=2737536 RepID=UPI0039E349C0
MSLRNTPFRQALRLSGGMMASTVEVVVGTVGRAHGLRGEVTIRLLSDFPEERFAPGVVLHAGQPAGRGLEVATSRWQGDMLLVAFRGYTDRSRAETLRGTELWAQVEAGEDDEGDFHDAALTGLEVRTGTVVRGRIASIVHNPGQDLLVVRSATGEHLVPFVTELVPTVDLAAGFVEVVDLPGLFGEPEVAGESEAEEVR